MKKILIVCGNGLGSSFIVEMNVKKIIKELNKEAVVSHTDLTSAKVKLQILFLALKILLSTYPAMLHRSLAYQIYWITIKSKKFFPRISD